VISTFQTGGIGGSKLPNERTVKTPASAGDNTVSCTLNSPYAFDEELNPINPDEAVTNKGMKGRVGFRTSDRLKERW